jgi:hypothetical protein
MKEFDMKNSKRNEIVENRKEKWSDENSRTSRLVWKKKKTSYRYTLNPIFSKTLHYCLDNDVRI